MCHLYSETTLNNMRKKGKPNPDQKWALLLTINNNNVIVLLWCVCVCVCVCYCVCMCVCVCYCVCMCVCVCVCRYFSLVVALVAHTANGNSYTVVAHVSERIIVRVSTSSSAILLSLLWRPPSLPHCRPPIQEHLITTMTLCGTELPLMAFTIW